MSEADADCVRSHTSVDLTGAKTLAHAREALSLDPESLGLIRKESEEALQKLAADAGSGT